MRTKNFSMIAAFTVMLALQGCGGGGTTSNSFQADKTENNKLNILGTESTENQNSTTEQNITVKGTNLVIPTSNKKYYLTEKKEIYPDYNLTTSYSYDDNNIIKESNTTSTDGTTIYKKYSYNKDTKKLSVTVKNLINEWELTQLATFEESNETQKYPYLYNTFASITDKYDVRLKSNITDIEKGLFNEKEYSYENGTITIKSGFRDSLDANFTQESSTSIQDLNHTFTISDDNKTVTEKDDKKIVKIYTFNKIVENN